MQGRTAVVLSSIAVMGEEGTVTVGRTVRVGGWEGVKEEILKDVCVCVCVCVPLPSDPTHHVQ